MTNCQACNKPPSTNKYIKQAPYLLAFPFRGCTVLFVFGLLWPSEGTNFGNVAICTPKTGLKLIHNTWFLSWFLIWMKWKLEYIMKFIMGAFPKYCGLNILIKMKSIEKCGCIAQW